MHWPQFYFRRYFATNDFTEFQFTTFSLVRSILAAAQLFSSVGLRYTLSLEWCDLLAFVVGRLGKAAEVRGRRSRTSNLESSSTTHLLCAVCSSKNSSVCNFVMFTDISNCRICLCVCLAFWLYDVSFESLDLQTSFWYAATSFKYLGQMFVVRSSAHGQGHTNITNKYTHSRFVCFDWKAVLLNTTFSLPERDYVTFGSLLSQFRLSVCLSVCLSSVVYL